MPSVLTTDILYFKMIMVHFIRCARCEVHKDPAHTVLDRCHLSGIREIVWLPTSESKLQLGLGLLKRASLATLPA